MGVTLNSETVARMALPPGKRDKFFWDDHLRGFALRVRVDASGIIRRSYVLNYRYGRQQRRIKLGDDCKISVDEARVVAQRYSAVILLGHDPQVNRKYQQSRTRKGAVS